MIVTDAAPGVRRVTGMPRGGIVRLNGNELTGIGWADPDTMTQYDLQTNGVLVGELRITDANGDSVDQQWLASTALSGQP
jgi:hypothetical protein